MDTKLEKELERLAEQNKWRGIVALVETIPENEWDLDIIGRYVRALNNSYELDKAVEVSLRYKALGENDALWHYRLGYAYLYLSNNDEAEKVLLRGRELTEDGDVHDWIDELLKQIEEDKAYAIECAEAEAKRRAAYVPRAPGIEPFEGFDFTDFWDDQDYSLEDYVGAPATDEMFAQAEQTLGYKLPESYKWLMRRHNGGIVKRELFVIPFATEYMIDDVFITDIMGVDPCKSNSLTGERGSRFMIEEWGYPDIGIAVCDTMSAGHDMVFLDYRSCGPEGEPEVVHIDQESDYAITWLAGDFESFVRGLICEDEDV